MRTQKTEAIILHTLPVRERDKLVVFLTPLHGKMKGWAYGARNLRSRFGAALEPLAKVRIGYFEKESEEAVRIESADLVRSLFPAQQNLVANVAASYIAEMVDVFAPEHDPAEVLYRLLDRSAESLLAGLPPIPIVAYAEVWVLRLAGIFPSMRECASCGEKLGRPLRFDTRIEGFICEHCATRESWIVPNAVIDEIETILRRPVEEFASQPIAMSTLLELRSLAGTIRRNFLGHEIKSFEVLTSVGAQ